jgi:hypothetical protein
MNERTIDAEPFLEMIEDHADIDLGPGAEVIAYDVRLVCPDLFHDTTVADIVFDVEIEVSMEHADIDHDIRLTGVDYDEYFSEPEQPRRFEPVRTEDVSGTSGTGVVARGVAYPDGAVHMQWLNADNEDLETDSNGCAFKPAPDGLEATREIHGHEGRTEIQWIDDTEDDV